MSIRISARTLAMVLAVVGCLGLASPVEADLAYTFTSGSDVAVTGSNYSASGALNLSLGFAPTPGTNLVVVKNTGLTFISGTFSGVPQGGAVCLSYGGTTYRYIANYFGGNGRSLVLQWPAMEVDAWGSNTNGQLGSVSGSNSKVPAAIINSGVLAGKTITAVVAGGVYSLALTSDGKVFAWGDNSGGELGNSSTAGSTAPVAVGATGALVDKTVIAVAAGFNSSLALTSDGAIYAWGGNSNGDSPAAINTSGTPLAGKTVIAIAKGYWHSMALTSDGAVYTWGDNSAGELGNGNKTSSSMPVAVVTTGTPMAGKTVVAIAAGDNYSMALTSDGAVYAWGNNPSGQLGTGNKTSSTVPVAVLTTGTPLEGKTVTAIAAGDSHSCAVTSDGAAFAWGDNTFGQLGNNSILLSSTAVAVTVGGTPLSGKALASIEAGSNISVALSSDHQVFAWGNNHSGQLGNSGTTNSSVAVSVSGGDVFKGKIVTSISTGMGHTLALVGGALPSVTLNPVSSSVKRGAPVTFRATASGTTTVQWQESTTGTAGTFKNISSNGSATTTTLTLLSTAAPEMNGYAYRAVFTDNNGGICTTDAATLTVAPAVDTDPVSQTAAPGSTVNFAASALGAPLVTVQWQVSTTGTGGTWVDIADNPSATTGTLILTNVSALQNGYAYRAVFTDSGGTCTTAAATLAVPPSVTTNPVNQVVEPGSTVKFSAAALGDASLSVQWQVSAAGSAGTFSNITDNATATTGTLTLANVSAAQNGYAYRAVFINSAGNCTSDVATLTVIALPSVTANPVNQAVPPGAQVSFSAAATGVPSPTVQWQVSTSGTQGTFVDLVGNATATTSTLTLTNVTTAQDGYAYRAVFTNVGGSCATTAALLTMAVPPSVTLNPVDRRIASGTTALFTAAASGSPAPDVRWQVSTTGTDGPFSDILDNASATTGTLVIRNVTSMQNGYAYRAIFTNNAPGTCTTTAAILSVPPSVTLNPVSQTVLSGTAVSFTAAAQGNPTPTVQWQVSTTGTAGAFTNIACTSTTLTLMGYEVNSAHDGYAYRAVFTNTGGVWTTKAAVLTVAVAPSVTLNPTSQSVLPGATVSFTATATGYPTPTVKWFASATGNESDYKPIEGNASADTGTLTLTNVSLAQNGGRYRAVFTNGGGSSTTTAATLTTRIQDLQMALASGTDVGLTLGGDVFVSGSLTVALGFAPTSGGNLLLIKNIGGGFINGRFSNVAQGDTVRLTYEGVTYKYIANYYGGNGRSLVLQWPSVGLAAWGFNLDGELGINGTTNQSVPVLVSGSGALAGKTVVATSGGGFHSLALTSDGQIFAWGQNPCGQLGNGTNTDSLTPVAVNQKGALAGKTVVAISAGRSYSLALTSDGQVYGWGRNGEGELGNNATTNSYEPVAVDTKGALAGKTVVAISAADNHSMALASDGQVYGWGWNGYGALGNSGTTQSLVPVAANTQLTLGGRSVSAISAGGGYSMALTSDNYLYAWGYNLFGALGTGGTQNCLDPVFIWNFDQMAGKKITAVATGCYHTLMLNSGGQVYAWGHNSSGELGDNSTTNRNSPVSISGSGPLAGKAVVSLAAGQYYSMALTADGQVYAWGHNSCGELGNNSTAASPVPVPVNTDGILNGKNVLTIATGESHSLALFALGAPAVTSHPVDRTVDLTGTSGPAVNFAAAATSDPGLSVQWQVSPTGTLGVFSNIVDNATATTGTLSLTNITPSQNGYAYRAVFTTNLGSCTTAAATLTVHRTFAWFQSQYGLQDPDPAADPNHTGVSQLMAYAFGVSPLTPDRSLLPKTEVRDNGLRIAYTRWKDATDVTYVVEVSSDLKTWDSGEAVTEQVSLLPFNGDPLREQVIVRDLNPNGLSRRFIRVRITH